MKYMIYLLAAIYIIGGYYVINVFFVDERINIKDVKNTIVIIIPENELISYQKNPNGLFENSKSSGIGLGFFSNKEGVITTVNHIVENNKIKYSIIYNGKKYPSKVFYRNEKEDIANLIIKTQTKIDFTYLNKASSVTINDSLYSFGVIPQKLEIIYNTGLLLNKKSKIDNISNLLQISNPLQPGFSGGPILNSNGEVIGINYAISQGKNYGITF